MEKLMGTNLHWDQGKQERCERKVLEEEKATKKQLLATATNKQLDEATTKKQLWGAEEDSGWYATSAKIISRLRSSFMQSQSQVLFTNRQYTSTFHQVPSERSQLSI